MKYFVFSLVLIALLLSSCRMNSTKVDTQSPDSTYNLKKQEVIDTTKTSKGGVTEDLAYQGVSNYCHSRYDWSAAEENPSMMYIQMGEDTETEYQVIFRSYTGAFVYFYVEKSSGTTRMIEYVPTLDVKNEVGTIDLFDYIKQ